MKTILKILVCISLLFSISCDDEPVGTVSPDDAITVNSELYNNIERVADENPDNNLVCIEFDYPFAINIFDEALEYVGVQVIGSDTEFSGFLASLQDGFSISLSYPITSVTQDGEIVAITNNDELKEVIDACLKEEAIGYCNGLLTSPDCIWKVIENDEGNTDYVDAYFDIDDLGQAIFNYEDSLYFGTWITFYIEDELHINISLDDDTDVGADWNIDWKVTIIDENNMILDTEGRTFAITRECEIIEETCSEFEFEACELNADEGIAEFYLDEYIECFTNFIEYETNENTIISFHVTQSDAENNVNAAPTAPFWPCW